MKAQHINRYRILVPGLPLILGVLVFALIAWTEHTAPAQTVQLSGLVLDESGAGVVGAVVRIRGHSHFTLTDSDGYFELPILERDHYENEVVQVTAWATGYFVGGSELFDEFPRQDMDNLEITLHTHPRHDHESYEFISPLDKTHATACGHCHVARESDITLPVDEWLRDAHSTSAINPRFLSLYAGTTLDGEIGIPTSYHFDSDYGIDVPLISEAQNTATGPGFRLDFPNESGNCATCHVPVLALQNPYDADPTQASGVAEEGIGCDFCHKIQDVRLQANGMPVPGLTGALSLEFLRPDVEAGEQVFIGPFDDTPGDDIFSALTTQSEYCAACHTATFWDVPIYNSFGEWLDSPYSDPDSGIMKTCQDCHMPSTGAHVFAQLPPEMAEEFVPHRVPESIPGHFMPGAMDEPLLQETATLDIDTRRENNVLYVTVRVTNTGAGHHIPTDSPLRNMILLVNARHENGESLNLLEGAVIPEWGGVGNPEDGYYAGLPGVLYAKILEDIYTGESPTFAYWRQTRLVDDNRIPALQTNESHYQFALPEGESAEIEVQLYLRRAFIDLMTIKKWDTPDMLMAQQKVVVK